MKKKLCILSIGIGLIFFSIILIFRTERRTPLTDQTVKNETAAGELASRHIMAPLREALPATASSSAATNVAQPSGPNLSATILTAIGKGEQKHFRARLEAIGEIGDNLSIEERQALYAYARDTSEDKWLRPGQAFALKNDIVNRLRDQQKSPAELTDFLIELRRDTNQPLVMRDYALQHLAPWYSKGPADDHGKTIHELEAAASETDRSYAGTALIGLHRIEMDNIGVKVSSLTERITALINDHGGNLLARISALQLVGERGLHDAQKSVKRIAADAAEPTTLRIAALGCLGRIRGDDSDSTFHDAVNGTDERLKWAAKAAMNR